MVLHLVLNGTFCDHTQHQWITLPQLFNKSLLKYWTPDAVFKHILLTPYSLTNPFHHHTSFKSFPPDPELIHFVR